MVKREPRHPVQEGQNENGAGIDGDPPAAGVAPERVCGELDLPGNGERQARGGGEAENPRRIAGSVRTAIAEEASSGRHPISIPTRDEVVHLATRLAMRRRAGSPPRFYA